MAAQREKIIWQKVLNNYIPLNVMLNVLPTKGNLVYEYNPLRNYRLTSNKYLYKGNYYSIEDMEEEFRLSPYYLEVEEDKEIIKKWTQDSKETPKGWIHIEDNGSYTITNETPELYETGQLVDFISDELTFSLDHPVHIVPQYSYDGSVNLIINDGLNIPRLINTRFSATGRNTYEIVDRKGNTDTNIYDSGEQFDIDTSLYKIVDNIPEIKFLKTSSGGNLKVGNYHFYFKLADADGNETDFVAESGLVSVFIGEGSYGSVHTGTKNENSTKQVEFGLSNIDPAYDYIIIYFSRSTAEGLDNSVTEYVKINKKFSKTTSKLVITGFEEMENVTAADINLQYNIVGAAKTSAVCQNMLFLGNVKKQDIPYEELQDLSIRILPFLGTKSYDPGLDVDYSVKNHKESYINANFIYHNTGYWPNEYYRFGIVYILPNGELTPVFNVRGAYQIDNTNGFSHYELTKNGKRNYIKYNDTNFFLADSSNNIISSKNKQPHTPEIIDEKTKEKEEIFTFENVKGVCTFNPELSEDAQIYYVNFHIPSEVRDELKKHIKGYFFVRQTRIPTKLAQGITIGIDNESRTPTIPTWGGVLDRLSNTLDKTHVVTKNIRGLNYITEGFLRRYTFKFEKKSSSIWGKIGKIAGVAALVVGAAACMIVPGGQIVGALGIGSIVGTVGGTTGIVGIGAAIGLGATTSLAIAGAAAGAVVGAALTSVVASTQELGLAIARIGEEKELNGKATVAPSGYKIVETEESRTLTDVFDDRIIIKDGTKNQVQGIICPDYTVNQAYYNQIFTGNEHYIEVDTRQSDIIEGYTNEHFFQNDYRHFYIEKYKEANYNTSVYTKVIAVPDNIVCTGIDNILFRSRAGEAEEAWRYKCVGEDITEVSENSQQKINSDIVRGSFGPYLGFLNETIGPAKIVNIYAPGYNPTNTLEYIDIRMNDNSTYYAITDRKSINNYQTKLIGDINNQAGDIDEPAYRGDCYICQFTQRINRNFNDPSAPYNDEIIDVNTWRDNYDPQDTEKYQQINLGDVNAVPLGMWVTFQLRSSNNLNIRTLDGSNVDESAMTGNPRGYFPAQPMSTEGVYKKQESQVYNKGFAKSVSDKWNFEVPNVPHIKNWFGTRIMYSDIHINDAFKNGFRVFQGTHYRDYTREYGEIVKLVPFESSLLCIFEHGVALIPVNERAVAGQGAGGNVYINTSNVLPENPKIISDMFGSQWPESILKVPGRTGDAPQYVYGVDTVAKKIWRTDGNSIECISDFKVQEFLNNNITLGERELTPKIGIRNVKTHYNAFKRDVMFTFYDNTYGFEEKVWNLCWNELLQKFITFYSWVPSYMENINNVPFSFDRNTSKWIAKLGTSHTKNSFADGITLSNNIINNDFDNNKKVVDNFNYSIEYITKSGEIKTISGTISESQKPGYIGVLSLSNRTLPNPSIFYDIKYSISHDQYSNYKNFEVFEIKKDDNKDIRLPSDALYSGKIIHIYGLRFKINDQDLEDTLYIDNEILTNILYFDEKENNYQPVKWYKGLNGPKNLLSDLYYRNVAGNTYADTDDHKKSWEELQNPNEYFTDYPIFKDLSGKRPTLPREKMLNPDKLVTLLNIKAEILIEDEHNQSLSDQYYDHKSTFNNNTSLINMGCYESVVAIAPKWNLQFLSTDFWKHGQAGIIDIADDIKPTYWYGKQHPFEFEVVVVNDPSVHKIFSNLELVANKAKPESFHYEIIGESYDFAKDKPNMYFRQEALKALWQYNGADIVYDRNFLKVQPKQQPKSADLPHRYYTRQDTINDVEDYYISVTYPQGYDYRHLSGGEIIYYPNRQEYRIWNHAKAIDIDDLSSEDTRSIIAANCQYLEDRWKVTINPILVCYKNEYSRQVLGGPLIQPLNTDWKDSVRGDKLPPFAIKNSPIPDKILEQGGFTFPNPDIGEGKDNALYNLYKDPYQSIDLTNWLNDVGIYRTDFGEAQNRKEVDLKDKFMKVRIRYSGEELAVIDFLNTIYRVSYA